MIFSRLPSLVAKVVGSPPHLGISHIQVVANNIWWAKQYHCMDITIRWTCSFLSNHFTDLDANPLKDQNKKSKTKHNKKQIHTIHCRLKRKYNIKKKVINPSFSPVKSGSTSSNSRSVGGFVFGCPLRIRYGVEDTRQVVHGILMFQRFFSSTRRRFRVFVQALFEADSEHCGKFLPPFTNLTGCPTR